MKKCSALLALVLAGILASAQTQVIGGASYSGVTSDNNSGLIIGGKVTIGGTSPTLISGSLQAWGAPVWEAAWSSGASYVTSNVVTYSGVTYIASQSSSNQTPSSSSAYWAVLIPSGQGFGEYVGNNGLLYCVLTNATNCINGTTLLPPALSVTGVPHTCASSCTSSTATISNAGGTGHVMLVGFYYCLNAGCTGGSDTVTSSVADTTSNSYTSACGTSGTVALGIHSYWTIPTSGSNTVTVTTGSTVYFLTVFAEEFTGSTSSPLDQCVAVNATSTNPTVTTSGPLAQSNEILYGLVDAQGTVTAGSGFTKITQAPSGANSIDEYQVGGTSGTTATINFTDSTSANYAILGITLKHP